MHCHACGVEIRDGQKFCMECGASLRGVADVTGEVPVVRPAPNGGEATRPISIITTPTPPPPVTTGQLTVIEATTPPAVDRTGEVPQAAYPPAWAATVTEPPPARRFRLRPLLLVALLASVLTVVGVLTTVIEINAEVNQLFDVGPWKVNDFGTNNAVAALLASGAMVLGALLWCFGFRWGAGLAGGAGTALAGWALLVLGLAEYQISTAERGAAVVSTTITRDIGYWALATSVGVGGLAFLVSLARSGRGGRSGLDPWIAALGAVSVLIAAGGPLIPVGDADWTGNYSSDTLSAELPTLLFTGRLVQLGLLALCGVVGFLLVRPYGLGLAVGSAVASSWMLVTAATDQTATPIGPAWANPDYRDLQPHAVTIVGFGLVGFFSLVAIVMALLDADR